MRLNKSRFDARGSVLAWVLVSSVILMIICSSMARIILMRAQQTARQGDSITGAKYNHDAVARLISVWTTTGADQSCSSNQAVLVNYTVCNNCTPGGGTSAWCTLTGTVAGVPLPGVRYEQATKKLCADSSGAAPAACP